MAQPSPRKPRQPRRPRQPRQLSLKLTLRKRLECASRIAVLAVGSDLRADDAAGLLTGRHLATLAKKTKPAKVKIKIFFGETAPENFTGQIRQFRPTHLVVLDAADSKRKPGSINITDLGSARSGCVYCTHNMPLTVMIGYLSQSLACDTIILGIQPGTLEFDKPPSALIIRSALKLAQTIHAAIVE
jgi:hydrogenase 3 maturation protease